MLRPPLLQSTVSVTICDPHGEKEKFYCEEDQRKLCNSCLLAPEHKGHQVLPLETAVDKCKDKLQKTLTALQKKEKELKMALHKLNKEKNHLKENASSLKILIVSQYGEMHQFLWDEEFQYFQILNQEFSDNLAELNKNKTKLHQQTQTLQGMIIEIEENLDKVPLEMLQNMKSTVERNKEVLLQEPQVSSPSWSICPITGLREVLMCFQRDITLDPETANPHLIVSEDLKRVQYGRVPQDLPDNKERFDIVLAVLGAQTFTSGKHYWEVEVGEKTEWELGICKDSVRRKGKLSDSSEDIRTLVGFTSRQCFFLQNSEKSFQYTAPIQKVGIFLDYEMGHVAFYDVRERCPLLSFPNTAFQGPLQPYFSFCLPNEESTSGSLIICSMSSQ